MKEQPRKGRFSNGNVKIDSLLQYFLAKITVTTVTNLTTGRSALPLATEGTQDCPHCEKCRHFSSNM